MEVTRQLRKDKLTKAGLAPIHLTFWWNNLRLRIASGEKCQPKDWNETRQQVKNNPGAYADDINGILDRYTKAAEAIHLADRQAGYVRPVAEMEAEIRRQHALLSRPPGSAAELLPLPPVLAPTPTGLLPHFDAWIAEQARKVSLRSGQPLSKSYLQSLTRTRQVVAEFYAQRHPERVLEFAAIDHGFYADFQHYVLTELAKDVNTFGKYVRQLKTFLAWADDHDLGVSGKYRRFEAPSHYVGADALTQAELLALAAVDFRTDVARAYVTGAFAAEFALSASIRPQVNGSRHSQIDALRVSERLRLLELSRDKLLECCYFGLRISDANRLAPEHLRGELARIQAGKTQVLCLIPYFDDDVFKPVALVQKYAHLNLRICLPVVVHLSRYLPHVAQLAGITRLPLTSKIGRKTFATLKIYQGIPKTQVMLATGHQTETSFNRYLGIDEAELVDSFRKTARRVAEKGGGLEASAA